MSDTTIDQAAKQRVKDALIAQATAALAAVGGTVDQEQDASEVDTDDTVTSASETAQSSEELALSGQLEDAAAQQRADLDRIAELDVSPTETVREGAVVSFDGQRYLVGVVASPFACDGESYEGLSVDAPIYAVVAGLRAGDTFTFRDTEHRIDLVG